MHVTVLVPTHFRSAMLRDALTSLVNQTHTDWTAIVFDNGGDTEWVERFDPRIAYKRFPEVSSMEHGQRLLDAWDGEGFACFLHDDDAFAADSLARRYEAIGEADVLACTLDLWTPSDPDAMGVRRRDCHEWTSDFRQWVDKTNTPSLFFTGAVKAFPLDTDSQTGTVDMLWQYRMFMGGLTFDYLDEPLYLYRIHSDQESNPNVVYSRPEIFEAEQARQLEIAAAIQRGERDPRLAGLWTVHTS